ncbi:MAG TPA: hypothetical protein VK403_01285 [Allosphingosinicella sp.]|nr:hypothetical protein [Allosphingosinicella sp.]
MAKLCAATAMFLLAFWVGPVKAQPPLVPQVSRQSDVQARLYLPEPARWVEIGSRPVASIRKETAFDLAFASDHLPVLASVAPDLRTVELRKWDGRAWTNLADLPRDGDFIRGLKMASSSAGDIILAVSWGSIEGSGRLQVVRLADTRVVSLDSFSAPDGEDGYAVAFDGRNALVATASSGLVSVKRWDGTDFARLGQDVDRTVSNFFSEKPVGLAVTDDGTIVVAHSFLRGSNRGISTKYWTGLRWAPLGEDIPVQSLHGLGGGDGGAPLVAFNNGAGFEVSRWNGSVWSAATQPCEVRGRDANFGRPSLTIGRSKLLVGPLAPGIGRQLGLAPGIGRPSVTRALSQPIVVCGIGSPNGARSLFARALVPSFGWTQLGTGSINDWIPPADDRDLFVVARADGRGRLWVGWTVKAEGGPRVMVSTLVPLDGASP